jgi:TctA family transporter
VAVAELVSVTDRLTTLAHELLPQIADVADPTAACVDCHIALHFTLSLSLSLLLFLSFSLSLSRSREWHAAAFVASSIVGFVTFSPSALDLCVL